MLQMTYFQLHSILFLVFGYVLSWRCKLGRQFECASEVSIELGFAFEIHCLPRLPFPCDEKVLLHI